MTGGARGAGGAQVTAALADIVGAAHVSSHPAELVAAGLPAGPAGTAWLVRPGSASEVAQLVGFAAQRQIAVIPVGNLARAPAAGSLRLVRDSDSYAVVRAPDAGAGGDEDSPGGGEDLAGSAENLADNAEHPDGAEHRDGDGDGRARGGHQPAARLYVDSRRMNHILHLDETSLIVHAQAGLTALELERVLQPRGLSLGDYPPAALGSTIGGLLAVRTPGKSSARHGFVEDAVLGVSAVLADGRTIHTRVAPRRSTGPDLARALCGSEGTLGFITSAVLRIHRAPEARFLAAYALPDFAAAIAAVNLALREEAAPSALRVYGAREARVHLAGAASAGGLGAHEAALVVATAGPTDLAACDRDLFTSAVEAMGGRSLDVAVAETWWRRRSGRADGPLPPLPSLQVTAAPPRQVPVYEAVFAAVRDAGARARVHASRFDYDGAVLFFSLTDDADQMLRGGELARIRGVAEAAAERAGAVLLGRLNPALDPYLLELRRALDPRGIMNPDALSR